MSSLPMINSTETNWKRSQWHANNCNVCKDKFSTRLAVCQPFQISHTYMCPSFAYKMSSRHSSSGLILIYIFICLALLSNTFAETFGSQSHCIEHGLAEPWTVNGRLQPGGSGCYQVYILYMS